GAPARTARRGRRRASGGVRCERPRAAPGPLPSTCACAERLGDSALGTIPRTARRAGSRYRRWCRTPAGGSPPPPHVAEASALPGGAVVAPHHRRPKGDQLERLADRLGLAAPAEDRLCPLERRRVEEHVLADQRRHRRLRIRMIRKDIRMHAPGQREPTGRPASRPPPAELLMGACAAATPTQRWRRSASASAPASSATKCATTAATSATRSSPRRSAASSSGYSPTRAGRAPSPPA